MQSRKIIYNKSICKTLRWNVVSGLLESENGNQNYYNNIFEVIAEKIPFTALEDCKEDMENHPSYTSNGVYLAHDSMGVARYGGRGDIFTRLAAHKKKYPDELSYFSFYTIKLKSHSREIETVILRAAGPQLILNDRKVRIDIDKGDVKDYEPGTWFYERQKIRGKKSITN